MRFRILCLKSGLDHSSKMLILKETVCSRVTLFFELQMQQQLAVFT